MPPTARVRFLTKLNEQIRFLNRSCLAFDEGEEDEALRMATSMRVLFWDKGQNVSLLSHLHLRHGCMLSIARGHADFRDYLGYHLNLSSATPVKAVPLLGSEFKQIPFAAWWHHEPVFVHDGQKYSRETIVLSAAHKDGGAHVDAKLDKYYELLASGKFAFGITGDLQYKGIPPFRQGVTLYANNAHLSLLRQFAHETLASAKHFNWTNDAA